MSGWAAVLFDLDGTLADTVDLILSSYRHTMRTHFGESPPDERWLATMGTPLASQLRAFAKDDEEAGRLQVTYTTYQRGVHDRMVRPFPGAVEVTDQLRRMGVGLAVVTSKKTESARRTIECCGLASAFDAVVCADQVERAKPHPEPVERALAELGLTGRASEVLFVGDSPFDLEAGRLAGTWTAAATWGPFARSALEAEGPDFWLASLREVLTTEPEARLS